MGARRLTAEFARRVKLAPGGAKTYSDGELRGFYLRVNKDSKSWIAQRRIGGRPRRVLLGHFPEVDAAQAREKALQALAAMGEGRDPAEERRRALARGMTLGDAVELHLASGTVGETSESHYRKTIDRYLSDWLSRSLRELGQDRRGVRERHARITKKNGERAADFAMGFLRAVYNRALREHPELPPNPVDNVDFNGGKQRVVDLAPERLKAWGQEVLALPGPVRRDLHLFMLLTGMRRTSACEVRAEHIAFEAAVLRVPKPKGGAKRAFDLPLSRPLLDLVRHRIAENRKITRDNTWLFPSPNSKTGRVTEVKEQMLGGLFGHALRHAYSSLALEAGVPVAELKFLLNHKVADVTFGYLNPGIAHLRECQERASARILEAVRLRWVEGAWPPTACADQG